MHTSTQLGGALGEDFAVATWRQVSAVGTTSERQSQQRRGAGESGGGGKTEKQFFSRIFFLVFFLVSQTVVFSSHCYPGRKEAKKNAFSSEKQPSSGADDSSEPGQENSPRFVRDASCTRFAFEDNRLCKLYLHAGAHRVP